MIQGSPAALCANCSSPLGTPWTKPPMAMMPSSAIFCAGRPITLEAPKVAVYPIQQVSQALSEVLQGEVASVHQVFSGPVSGNALLLLNEEAAVLLNSLLLNAPINTGEMRTSEREALTEV